MDKGFQGAKFLEYNKISAIDKHNYSKCTSCRYTCISVHMTVINFVVTACNWIQWSRHVRSKDIIFIFPDAHPSREYKSQPVQAILSLWRDWWRNSCWMWWKRPLAWTQCEFTNTSKSTNEHNYRKTIGYITIIRSRYAKLPQTRKK